MAPVTVPLTFSAVLEHSTPNIIPTQIVVVPPPVVEALGGKTARRVLCTIGQHTERLGLLPLAGGGRYLMLRKDLCQALGLVIDQELTLALAPDPNPDHIDLPDELAEALAAWPEAETHFHGHTGAMKRAMARHVADAKRRETRLQRAVQLTERLGRNGHPFRTE